MAYQAMAGASSPEITVTAYFIPLSVVAKWPASGNPVIRRWYIPYAIVLLFLATISLLVRFYAQFTRRIRKFGIDDIFLAFAWLIAVAFTASTIWGVVYGGFDRHIWENILIAERSGIIAWSSEAMFLSSTCLTKLSVLAFQRRLLQRTHNPKITRSIDFAIVFVVAYWIAFLGFLIGACTPIEASWKSLDIRYPVPYKCRKRHVVDTMVGVVSVITDVYALIIPELLIYSLRMEKRQKALLYFVFGSGALATGAGIARTYWLSRLSTDPLRDLTWVGYEAMVWGQLETQLAIVCASAPALKAFISKVKAGTTRSRSDRSQFETHMSPFSKPKSQITTTIEEEVAEGKGILVTETLSLKSAVMTPSSLTPGNIPSDVEAPPYSDIDPERPSYSSQTLLRPTYLPQKPPQHVSHRTNSSSNSNSDNSRPTFENFMSRDEAERLSNQYRPLADRQKAMKIMGG